MRICSMTATFGKLEQAELTLKPGLNQIAAPNEWGKSTWCAFVLAMLYGIDTRSRSTRSALSEKEHYQPWSGRPMAGRMELIWQGRAITIQRRTRGRVPLGEFAAFETETGLPVPELTAENCGQLLLGVERSVFQRTGFIRLEELPVIPDEALRRRLNALVTTGDESGAADLLGTRLRELKNRCRYNKTGLIPQVEGELAQCRRNQAELERLQARSQALTRHLEAGQQELSALQNHLLALNARDWTEAARAAEEAKAKLTHWQQVCASLPPRSEIDRALEQGHALQTRLQAIALAPEPQPAEAPRKKYGFFGVFCLILGIISLIAAIFWGKPLGFLVPLGLLTAGAMQALRQKPTPAPPVDPLRAQRERLRQELRELTSDEDLPGYLSRWQTMADQRNRLAQAEQEARQARQSLSRLSKPAEPAPDRLTWSREETLRRLETGQAQQHQLQFSLGQCRGELAAFSGFENREAALTRRLAELHRTEAALELALSTLEEAQTQLQRRFAPRIAAAAQDYFTRLTGGRYEALALDRELNLSARARSEDTLRSALWRSSGTADQLYLALRLASAQALTPEAPILADDVLARFDPERRANALALLEELGTQVVLFTTGN